MKYSGTVKKIERLGGGKIRGLIVIEAHGGTIDFTSQ
jgi:hypothetical protein